MPRHARITPKGYLYHILNRSAGRIALFRKPADYAAFERVLLEAHARTPLPLLAYTLMPNHWHFVVRPTTDTQITDFFRWLTHTHAMRWRVAHHTVGYGHLYQGRFKSFPIQGSVTGEHLLAVCRYIERNPLTAKLVPRAQDWPHSSLSIRQHGPEELRTLLSDWPTKRPSTWIDLVNRALTKKEKLKLQTSLQRSRPYGDDAWIHQTAQRLNLQHTLRPEGRPKSTETTS
jgi:putative transposase